MPAAIIKGGTRSRIRIVKPIGRDFVCCGELRPYYWTKCPNCATPRPN